MIKWIAGAFILFIFYTIYLANNAAHDHIFFVFVKWLPYGDKFGHLGLIGTLALLVNLAIGLKVFRGWYFGRTPILLGTIIISILVILEEFSQLFLINRTFDLGDLAFDFIGIVLANWAAATWLAYQDHKRMQSI